MSDSSQAQNTNQYQDTLFTILYPIRFVLIREMNFIIFCLFIVQYRTLTHIYVHFINF